MYPLLARYTIPELQNTYKNINDKIRVTIIPVLCFYYILVILIKKYYYQYSETLDFLNIIVITMYMQSFMYVLQNTYYKVLRIERKLMVDNLVSIAIVFVVGFPVYYLTGKLVFVALSTLFAQIVRYSLSYYRIRKSLKIDLPFNFMEFSMISVFIILSSLNCIDSILELSIFAIISCCYVAYNSNIYKSLIIK